MKMLRNWPRRNTPLLSAVIFSLSLIPLRLHDGTFDYYCKLLWIRRPRILLRGVVEHAQFARIRGTNETATQTSCDSVSSSQIPRNRV